jgi:hypothetical protein
MARRRTEIPALAFDRCQSASPRRLGMEDPPSGFSVRSSLDVMGGARQNAPKGLSIRELPRAERPRERLKAHGAHALSSAELLAIIVGSGGAGRSALGLAHEAAPCDESPVSLSQRSRSSRGSDRHERSRCTPRWNWVGAPRARNVKTAPRCGRHGTFLRCSRRDWRICRWRSFTSRCSTRSTGWSAT